MNKDIFSFGSNIRKTGERNSAVGFDDLPRIIKRGLPSDPEVLNIDRQLKQLHQKALNELQLDANSDEFKSYKKEHITPLKESQRFFIFGGHCPVGHNLESLEYNGHLQGDIDFKFPGGDIAAQNLKKLLRNDPFIKLVGISPSGFGVKFLVETTLTDKKYYNQAMDQLYRYLVETYPDEICAVLQKDNPEYLLDYCDTLSACSPCFVFIDDDVYVNKKAANFQVTPPKSSGIAISKVIEYDTDLSRQLAEAIQKAEYQEGEWEDWYQTGYAFFNICGEEVGEKLFFDLSKKSSKYEEKKTLQTWKSIVKRKPDRKRKAGLTTIKKFLSQYCGITVEFAKKNTSVNKLEEPNIKTGESLFWETDYIGEISIKQAGLVDFFTKEGFKKSFINETDYTLLQLRNNLVKPISTAHMADYMMAYIRQMPELLATIKVPDGDGGTRTIKIKRDDLREKIVGGRNVYLSSSLAMLFDTIELKINRDTKDKIFFYFKNGVVEVTKDGVVLKKYSDLDNLVWKSSIIDHNIELNGKTDCDFSKFLSNVTGRDEQRRLALQSAIGYILSTFKDPSKTKVITLLDEAVSDNPQGRTGKGLIYQAISQVRRLVSINGKAFDPGSAFALQEVKKDTEIIVFQDVKRKFPFEWLYSAVTDGFSVNPKGKPSFFLPFEESPKFGITSNYMIEGEGSSHSDRIYEVELAPYYNDKFKPVDEFRRQLFGPVWDHDEWNSFYQLMFSCAKDYLKYDLIQAPSINLAFNKLRQFTSPEFVEFCDSALQPGIEYNKKDLFEGKSYTDYADKEERGMNGFTTIYPDFQRNLTQRTFTKWLMAYAEYKGFSFEDRKSGANRFIKFYEHDLQEEEPKEAPF